jgi:hypothetical protein
VAPGAQPVRRIEVAAPSGSAGDRSRQALPDDVHHARHKRDRLQVELTILTVVLVMIVVATTAAMWLNRRGDDQSVGGGAAGTQALNGRTSGAELIRAENAREGSPEWAVGDGDARPRGIEGFTDRVSGEQGVDIQGRK